jgi:hypothetical protein
MICFVKQEKGIITSRPASPAVGGSGRAHTTKSRVTEICHILALWMRSLRIWPSPPTPLPSEGMVSRGEALCRDHRRTGWGKEVEKALRQVMGGAMRAVDGQTDRRTDGQAEKDERARVREEFRRVVR